MTSPQMPEQHWWHTRTGVVIFVLNFEKIVQSATSSALPLLGTDPFSMTGREISEFIHPHDLPLFAGRFDALLSHPGNEYAFHIRISSGQEQWAWIEAVLSYQPSANDSGLLVMACSLLRMSKEVVREGVLPWIQHQDVYNTIDDGILVFSLVGDDSFGRFRYSNEHICRLLDYSHEELMTMTIRELDSRFEEERYISFKDRLLSGETVIYKSSLKGKYGEIAVEIRSGFFHSDSQPLVVAVVKDIRSHLEVERSLAESTQTLEMIMEHTPELIWMTDSGMQISYVNRRWLEFTGLSGKGHSRADWLKLIHPLDRRTVLKRFGKALKKQDIFSIDYRFLRYDGYYRWLQNEMKPRYDIHGDFIGYIGYCRDITERIEIADLLKKSLDYEHALTQIISMAVREKDHVVFMNRSLTILGNATKVSRVYMFELSAGGSLMSNNFEWCAEGVTPQIDNLKDIPVSDFSWWFDMLRRNHIIKYSDIEEIPDETTREILRPQGILSILIVPVWVNGDLLGFIGFDECSERQQWEKDHVEVLIACAGMISGYIEQRQAEQRLLESEKQFRGLFETMSQGVVYQDAGGTIISANSSAERILGLSLEQMKGKTSMDPGWMTIHENGTAYTGEDHPAMKALASGQEHQDIMGVFNPAKKRHIWLNVNTKPEFRKGESSPFRVFTTFEDISVLKDALAELDRTNQDLEALVEQRAKEVVKLSQVQQAILGAFPDLMFRLDPQGKILDVHCSNQEDLSAPPAFFLGKVIKEVMPDNVADRAMPALDAAFSSGEVKAFEYSIQIKNQSRQFECRVSRMNDHEALAIIRDISVKHQAVAALQYNESMLKMMTSSSPLAFLVIDNRTDEVLYFNQKFCKIWGIEHLEVPIGNKETSYQEILRECNVLVRDQKSFSECCERLGDVHNGDEVEDEIPLLDGRIIRRYSSLIRGPVGEYFGRLHIFEDITERRTSEQFIRIQRDMATGLNAISDLNEALSFALGMFLCLDNVDAGGIYYVDNLAGKLNLAVHRGLSEEFLQDKYSYDLNSPNAGIVMKGEPFYTRFPLEPDLRGTDPSFKFRSLAVIPIKDKGCVVGAINLASKTVTAFYQSTRFSLEGITGQLGSAINRILAEKNLRISQQNLKTLFDTIDDLMFILDEGGNILHTNPIVRQLLGYTEEELKKMHVLTVHPPARREEAGRIVQAMLEGTMNFCPVPFLAKDGSCIPVETRVVKGTWDGKEVMYGISRDITERQRAEAALKMQSSAFESFALPIIITSREGRIRWANSAFQNLTGYKNSEIMDRSPGELVSSGLQDAAFYEEMWNTILEGKVWSGELINRKKDGSTYAEEMTITPVPDFEGKISSFIAIKIDITRRKAIENALKDSIEREKEINELKSKFISMTSHEFKTPLATILAVSESLLAYWDRMSEEQQKGRLVKIKEQVKFLNDIIEEMLELSRIQALDRQLLPEMFDLVVLFRSVVEEFTNQPENSNQIELKLTHEVISVYLDRNELRKILNNLLSNAIKYSGPGGKITVSLELKSRSIQFSVKDKGIGIPEEEVRHVFEPFFRASNTGEIRGSGLGLPIVREAVERHGGSIRVGSRIGEGTNFEVSLPIRYDNK